MSKLWRALKRFYLFILPVRFSLLAIVVVGVVLLVTAQGRDIMRALALRSYVPGGVPCGRGAESRIPNCIGAGCGELSAAQGEER
jgi:hypothetical protein